MTLKAGKIGKLPLAEGEYELKFVSAENAKDKLVENFKMPPYDKLYSVELSPIREKRLEQERIAEETRRKAEQERLEQERLAAERKAKEEAEKKAKEEAERKAREAEEKKAKEEAERQARLETEKKAREKAEKERQEHERKDRERQEEEKKQICRTVSDGLVFNIKGVEFKMVNVAGGSFWMGADDGKYTRTVKGFLGIKKKENYVNPNVRNYDPDACSNEYPVHKVTLSKYYIGETTVTQALWKAVMGSEPAENGGWESRYGRGDNYPAYRVNYDDIVNDFLPKLNRLTGMNFRLPTEAEWEYAARGGKKSCGYKYSGSNVIGDVAWFCENSGDNKLSGSRDWDTIKKNNCKTHPVNCKKPNELGLYDMSGNVWEWCKDWYGIYSSSEQTNPSGPSIGSYRVLRGGGWSSGTMDCRVSYRVSKGVPFIRLNRYGFRLALPQ